MCWLLSMCFVWPLQVLQTDFFALNSFYWALNWGRLSFERCPLQAAQIWRFLSLERDRPLVPSVGSFGRWTQWLLLGCVEMLLTRSRLHHPGSDPGNGLSMSCAARDVPGSLLYLLLVLCPLSSTEKNNKKKAVKWKETSQGLLGGQHCYISFTLKLLLHNASTKWMFY